MDYFHLHLPEETILGMSNLALAHLGDAVYELMVRSRLCAKGLPTPKQLHQATISYVSAPAQARAVTYILASLTDAERDIFRRGRNAHLQAIPQHATREEYRTATALETLFGWLYLEGQQARLCALFDKMMEKLEQEPGCEVCH